MAQIQKEKIHTKNFLSWHHFFIFLLGAAGVGIASVICWMCSIYARKGLLLLVDISPYLLLIATPVGFALIVTITNRFCRPALGSGVPQTMAALYTFTRDGREALLSLRIASIKTILTFTGQAIGASTGREGPMVQIGASLMHSLARFVPAATAVCRHRIDSLMIVAGAATGVAATFNTPITGLIFVIEQIFKTKNFRVYGSLLMAIAVAVYTAHLLGGSHSYFSQVPEVTFSIKQWIPILVCAVVSGIGGGIFSLGMIGSTKLFPLAFVEWKKNNSILFAFVCGLVVAIIGLLTNNVVHGNGSFETEMLLKNPEAINASFAIGKYLATFFSCSSSMPGGLFAPSLGIGAGIGANMAVLMPYGPPAALILIGIATYFSGLFKAPFTGVMLVVEISGNHSLILPLLIAALVAAKISDLFCKVPLYETIAKNWV